MPTLQAAPVDSSGQVVARAWVSRTGHRLEIAETSGGADGILLSTGDSKFTLRLDKQGRVIEINSDDKVKIVARNGITVDAGSGPLELSGQKVTVSSQSDVAIEGNGQVSVKGNSGATVEGATVKVAGQGSAELSASGSVTVRGGVVRIN